MYASIFKIDWSFADLKLATEKDHMHYTGVSNHKIKENIRYLLETSNRNKVIIRTPMIPGMTATRENIKGIAKYLNGIYQYVSYEILNYKTWSLLSIILSFLENVNPFQICSFI